MHHARRAAAAAIAALLATSPCLSEPPRYRIEFLEPLVPLEPSTISVPAEILAFDGAGRGYGYSTIEQGGFRPVVWEAGELRELAGFPAGYDGRATGVSPSGTVVGEIHFPSWDVGGFRIENGAFTLLPTAPGATAPDDVNNDGWAVGRSSNHGQSGTPHLWRNGTVSQLPRPNDAWAYAEAINAGGEIVGTYAAGLRRAARWVDGQFEFLPAPPTSYESLAFDINDSGWIVGISTIEGGGGTGLLWRDGEYTTLELPGVSPQWVNAQGINNRGQIVGFGRFGGPFSGIEGFIWEDDTMYLLEDLIDEPIPPGEWRPRTISESGVIAGDVFLYDPFRWQGVLLIPIPAPGGLMLLGLAAAGFAQRGRR